jgi:hypothetical protein
VEANWEVATIAAMAKERSNIIDDIICLSSSGGGCLLLSQLGYDGPPTELKYFSAWS